MGRRRRPLQIPASSNEVRIRIPTGSARQRRVGIMEAIGKSTQSPAQANALADSGARAIAEFVSNVGHHLRTPLTVVLGMAKLLKFTSLNADQEEAVEMIDRSGEELLGHINQLLDAIELVNGQARLTPAPFDLRELLEQVAARTARAAQAKGIDARLSVAQDVPREVCGDEARLRDVLTHLCHNAVKFTSAGKVALSVEVARARTPAERPEISFTVADTGIGMDANTVKHAFEPFFQADSKAARHFRGAGLGLTIAQQLVKLMGGVISIRSAPGQGATFAFSVALERHAAEEPMDA
jgi:signal transduction histidine kinase